MRCASWFTACLVLSVGGVASAIQLEMVPVSSGAVTMPRLSKMVPARPVVEGMQGQKLFCSFGHHDNWRMWSELAVDPPVGTGFSGSSQWVGIGPTDLFVGGTVRKVPWNVTDFPVRRYNGFRWSQVWLLLDPTPTTEVRCVHDLAHGDATGRKLYAFGWERRPQSEAAMWASNNAGADWHRILRMEWGGQEWAWGDCANADGIVYGHTDKGLIRLAPDGTCSVKRFPSAHHAVLSLAAPNQHEVTLVVVEPAPAKTQGGIYGPPPTPLVHVHYSDTSMASWTELGTLFGAPQAAEFLGKVVGVVAFATEQPRPGARLLYTKDACQSWQEDFLPGARVAGIKIVNSAEMYLLLHSLDTGRLFYAKWKPAWEPARLHIMTPQPTGDVFKKVE